MISWCWIFFNQWLVVKRMEIKIEHFIYYNIIEKNVFQKSSNSSSIISSLQLKSKAWNCCPESSSICWFSSQSRLGEGDFLRKREFQLIFWNQGWFFTSSAPNLRWGWTSRRFPSNILRWRDLLDCRGQNRWYVIYTLVWEWGLLSPHIFSSQGWCPHTSWLGSPLWREDSRERCGIWRLPGPT